MSTPERPFLLKKWLIRAALLAAVVTLLALAPHLPHEQTFRVDLGDSAVDVESLTVRWAPKASEHASEKPGETSIEDWTGEVTFRYEKNRAPRVVLQETRLADGEYVVEIELNAEAGGAVTRKTVALAGGTTTIDVAGSVPHSTMEPASGADVDSGAKDGGS